MKKIILRNDSKGVALVLVIIAVMMLTGIGGFAANLAYNQRLFQNSSGGNRIRNYYRAQAGIVDACWRIRTNTGANFTIPATTLAYSLDVDNNGTNDTNVTIGALATGNPFPLTVGRPITSVGID